MDSVPLSVPSLTLSPSPLSLGKTVVSRFFAVTTPVSSRSPAASLVYGDATLTGTSTADEPLLVIARVVTATFSWVMNFLTWTASPPPVYSPIQWLGICARLATSSVRPVPSAIV